MANLGFYIFGIFSLILGAASFTPPTGILLMRLKRSPIGSLTYSGYNPNGGMTAFSSSDDFFPSFYQQRYNPYRGYPDRGYPDRGFQASSLSPQSGFSDSPERAKEPQADEEGKVQPSLGGAGGSQDPTYPALGSGGKKNKKKPQYPIDDEEDDDDAPSKGGKPSSSAKASFNAWFPIMLSMFPSGSGPSSSASGGSSDSGIDASGRSQSSRNPDRIYGTTVISNSVSHGRNGIASSHAVAYQSPDGGISTSPQEEQHPRKYPKVPKVPAADLNY